MMPSWGILIFVRRNQEKPPFESKYEEEIDMSSRVFQSIVLQMKECTDRVIGVIDGDKTFKPLVSRGSH